MDTMDEVDLMDEVDNTESYTSSTMSTLSMLSTSSIFMMVFALSLILAISPIVATEPPDPQINKLEQRLELLRKKALNEEMEAQPLMFDNWHEYSEKMQAMENDQKEIQELKKEIAKLKQKNSSPSK